MDENMDDMGVIHFKDQKLYLKEVSFNDNITLRHWVFEIKFCCCFFQFKSTKECKACNTCC